MKPVERELSEEEGEELSGELADALSLLPDDLDASDHDAVVAAIIEMVDAIRDHKRNAPRPVEETGFLLGLVLGNAMTGVSRFEWCHLTYDSGFESIGLVTWDRSFVCFPFHFVFELCANPERENTIGTLWEMIKQPRGPGAVANAYLPLG